MDIYKLSDDRNNNYFYHLEKDRISICTISPGLLFEPSTHDLDTYRLELQDYAKGSMINFSIYCRTRCEMYEIYNHFMSLGYEFGKVKMTDSFENDKLIDKYHGVRRIWLTKENILNGKEGQSEHSEDNRSMEPTINFSVDIDIPFTLSGLKSFQEDIYKLGDLGYVFKWILKENERGGLDYIIK